MFTDIFCETLIDVSLLGQTKSKTQNISIMKKKSKVIAALVMLIFLMSSCVYSLFPIYTEDTLVYLPELLGKWKMGEDSDDYIIISNGIDIDGSISVTKSDNLLSNAEPNVKITTKDFKVTLDDSEYLIIKGDTIRDKAFIENYYKQVMDSTFTQAGEKLAENLKGLGNTLNDLSNSVKPGTFTSGKKSYLMKVFEDGEPTNYEMHLVQIGDDLFMDLSATDDNYTDKAFESMVWFPVHTFMKVKLNGNKLDLIQFDLDKLNKLFKSNLIRLRNENVDGTILITAQPKELQKFLDKYSEDESVFEDGESYTRILQ
ncbi:MAG: hypothetical protein COW03_05480 [Cytophagales bacterium CG12_big_fil_rev_8_21_14_0_65_40_12]|nr:MAG: hypothetical protein COW03_05480 [Cytophagales bacterium CG12_big_fil_rev_8_21_14_0_65_40_12]PIW03742.1 MAG: hypothetical protein COW40_12960 [Cytophagales bacterium CG17_big_fil_post_rev_8_21_14_2_50_40_13]